MDPDVGGPRRVSSGVRGAEESEVDRQVGHADEGPAEDQARRAEEPDGREGGPHRERSRRASSARSAVLVVGLDSMRVHGGYGYTSEFPVERYYRDAAHLASSPTTNTADRAELARLLRSR